MAEYPMSYLSKKLKDDKLCNEDGADFFEHQGWFFLLIGDGQGSKTSKDRAISIAMNEFKEVVTRSMFHDRLGLAREIKRAYFSINRIFKLFRSYENEQYGLLTTGLTVIAINEQKETLLAHMGNCRVVLVRGGKSKLITDDHTLAFNKYKTKAIEFEDINRDSERSILTRYFGQPDDDDLCDMMSIDLKVDDLILLTTDGVHLHVSVDEMLLLLGESGMDLVKACDMVIELAKERQDFDDATISFMVVT